MEDDIRVIASKFEAVKIAMTQDKNGHVLKLSIHPNDTPEDIMRDLVGTRYMVALVRINDQDQPVASQATEEGIKAVKLAGTLCSDERFIDWLIYKGYIDDPTETAAAGWLRRYLRITSRKDLKEDRQARQGLLGIRDEFAQAVRSGQLNP